MPTEASSDFSARFADAIGRCWQRADPPTEWNLTIEQFRRLLERSVAHGCSGVDKNPQLVEKYLESLHARDLALASACSAGAGPAWDFFVTEFRPELYRAARATAGVAFGREIADALYADLYGLRESQGKRNSLFDYFHGRSKLTTWLRAVIAQRHVDEIRRARRTDPLEEDSDARQEGSEADRRIEGAKATLSPVIDAPPDPHRDRFLAMLQVALTATLGSLEPRDRLRLAYYYVDELTLAQIGKLFDEHEATVSRKLDRTRREVRKRLDNALRNEKKLTEEQVRLCYEYAQQEWPFDLTTALSRQD